MNEVNWIIALPKHYAEKASNAEIISESIIGKVTIARVNTGHELMSPEYTQPELEGIADALEYLLGAELLPENGFTDECVNALQSALEKTETQIRLNREQ